MGNFYSFLRLSSRTFRRFDNFLVNFCEKLGVVGGDIVLLTSLADASFVVG
jgi:hypothetical protein